VARNRLQSLARPVLRRVAEGCRYVCRGHSDPGRRSAHATCTGLCQELLCGGRMPLRRVAVPPRFRRSCRRELSSVELPPPPPLPFESTVLAVQKKRFCRPRHLCQSKCARAAHGGRFVVVPRPSDADPHVFEEQPDRREHPQRRVGREIVLPCTHEAAGWLEFPSALGMWRRR